VRLEITIDKLRCIVIRRHAVNLSGTAQGVKQGSEQLSYGKAEDA
jgi:hypothetical protein